MQKDAGILTRIAVIGAGACFAELGHVVTCVDKDESKIAAIVRGEIPIFEPGLDTIVATNVAGKRLDFTTDVSKAVAEADAVFIAVGTPSRRGDGHADPTYVYAATREIAKALSGFNSCGDKIDRADRYWGRGGAHHPEVNPAADVVVASGPEFSSKGRQFATSSFPIESWWVQMTSVSAR